MIELITYCMLFALIYIAIAMIAYSFRKKHQTPPDEILALDLTNEEFIKTLNFLLMYGIIDLEEYNKLQVKSLPHLRG